MTKLMLASLGLCAAVGAAACGNGPGVTDTGTPTDTGTGTDGSMQSDAAADTVFTPTNFTPAQIATVLANPSDVDTGTGGVCNVSTDDGSWMCSNLTTNPAPRFTQVSQTGTSAALVWVLNSLIIQAGETVNIIGAKPAIFYVIGAAQVLGAVNITAGGATTGIGVGGDDNSGTQGAAGGSFCGAGGTGAPPATGAASVAGMTYGMANMLPLYGGSRGGGVAGGVGGGAWQLTSAASVTVGTTGTINAGGHADNDGNQFGDGGGSGGSVLLEAPTVTISGVVAANGGGGGDAVASGTDATPSSNPAPGGGTGGGGGSSGTAIVGQNGTMGTGAALGGGGGGAGRIRINTARGMATVTGTLSPATTTACTTQGMLGH